MRPTTTSTESTSQTQKEIRARLLEPTEANLEICGKRIREGKLVAFPTETVYGLGADATNEKAVVSIFEAKERPFTDPVIVHIADLDMLDKIFIDSKERTFIKQVGGILWPGPLTMIGPINESYIPPLVGSNTGTIGVRMPAHKLAQALIRVAQRPIAAPSANKFMHVSPTKGVHVLDDLKYEDVYILDGEMSDLGVESTVIRVQWDSDHYKVSLMRTGTFEFKQIEAKIKELFPNTEFVIAKKRVTNKETDVACAPGQLLKHYSPYVETFILSHQKHRSASGELNPMNLKLNEVGIIDFNKMNLELKDKVKLYFDLDESGDYNKAMKNLYNELRRFEETQYGLKYIFLANLQTVLKDHELMMNTLADKTFRSAAGNEVFYDDSFNFFTA